MEESSFLTLDNTTNLQSSKQYGTGTKTEYKPEEQDRKPSCTYGQLIYDQRGQDIQWKKDSLFNEWCWENWKATCKRMKVEHYLTPYTKINSKWIKDLNIRPDTIKPLEENISRMLFDANHNNVLFDPPPKIRTIKTQIDQCDLINTSSPRW